MSLWVELTDVLSAWLKSPSVSISVPIERTGWTSMKDIITLIDSISDVYDNAGYFPTPDGSTFCNLATTAVASAMGCSDFYGKTADEMIALMQANSDWSEVPFEKVQDMANQGSLLIAGLDSKALNQTHGHVTVIRPGKACYSGKWGLTPRCLNVGAENFLARAKHGPLTNQPCGLNESFIEMPTIWVWRQSL
jgi:hypothetical protein